MIGPDAVRGGRLHRMTLVGAAAFDGDDGVMPNRIIAILVYVGLRGGMAWLVAHEAGLFAAEKLNEVARALATLRPM